MKKLLKTTVIILVGTISLVFIGVGCTTLSSFLPSGDTIITGPTPTPTQQLWKAAKNSNWLVTLSILGIAAGAFAFLNGSKMGLPCIGASCISLFMALAVARFSTWMAVFGMLGSLAAVGISVVVKNRAVKEIVIGVQKYKDNNLNPKYQKILKASLAKQSISTKKIVQNVKNKLKGQKNGNETV